jgi:hypothetical protein
MTTLTIRLNPKLAEALGRMAKLTGVVPLAGAHGLFADEEVFRAVP